MWVKIINHSERVLTDFIFKALTKKSKQRMPKLPIIHGSDVTTKAASIDFIKIWRP